MNDPTEGSGDAPASQVPASVRPRSSQRADLSGQVFDHLTVIERVQDQVKPSGKRHPSYRCVCSCGEERVVRGDNLTGYRTTSCGHMRGRVTRDPILTEDYQYVPEHYGTGQLARKFDERERRKNGLR